MLTLVLKLTNTKILKQIDPVLIYLLHKETMMKRPTEKTKTSIKNKKIKTLEKQEEAKGKATRKSTVSFIVI